MNTTYTCFLELLNIKHPAFHIIYDKLFNSQQSKLLMIKEFNNMRERSERAKFLCLGYKVNNWRIEKNHGPKQQLEKILGPHFRRLCEYIILMANDLPFRSCYTLLIIPFYLPHGIRK